MTGVDPAAVMLRLARALTRGSKVAWVDGTAESLPLDDASATVLWSLLTVHHWDDIDQGLAEARRVLAPNGRLLAAERRSTPGATGHASHGWTDEQAAAFADRCRSRGVRRRQRRARMHSGAAACSSCRAPSVAVSGPDGRC